MTSKPAKLRRCFNCGEDIGVYADWDRLDTCGKVECEREARAQVQAERADAHARLDEEMGW